MTNRYKTKWTFRNQLALLCNFTSFIFFVPGITLAMLKMHTGGQVETDITDLSIEFFRTSNSILHAVKDLYQHNNKFVAIMICLFSVVVPIVKSVLYLYILLSSTRFKEKIYDFNREISKWAMCDVFVVATFLAYFSSNTTTHSYRETTILGVPMDVDITVNTVATLGVGFYFFVTYCFLSLISYHLYDKNFYEKVLHQRHHH